MGEKRGGGRSRCPLVKPVCTFWGKHCGEWFEPRSWVSEPDQGCRAASGCLLCAGFALRPGGDVMMKDTAKTVVGSANYQKRTSAGISYEKTH